jgi:hypothetical protein
MHTSNIIILLLNISALTKLLFKKMVTISFRLFAIAVFSILAAVQITWAYDGRRQYNNHNVCNYQLLSHTLSRKVKGVFDDAHHHYGCHGYSSVECKTTSQGFQCKISKKLNMQNGSPCQEHLLQKGLQHKVTKILRKGYSKYNCNVKSVFCSMELDGRTNCNVINGNNENVDASTSYNLYKDDTAFNECNLALLEQDVINEIKGTLTKSQIRYRCPKVDIVQCKREKNMFQMDCEVFVPSEAAIPSESCNMNYVTQELSEDIGESFVRSEMKYGCQLPEILNCKILGKEFPDYIDCNIIKMPGQQQHQHQHQQQYQHQQQQQYQRQQQQNFDNQENVQTERAEDSDFNQDKNHENNMKNEKNKREKQKHHENANGEPPNKGERKGNANEKKKQTHDESSSPLPRTNEQRNLYKKFFAKYNLRGRNSEM